MKTRRLYDYLSYMLFWGIGASCCVHFIALVAQVCQIQYNHAWRACLVRAKYRACAQRMRMYQHATNANTSLPFTVLNRDTSYLQESARAYLKHTGKESLVERLDFFNWGSNEWHRNAEQQETAQTKKTTVVHDAEEMSCIWPVKKGCFWISSQFGPRKKSNGMPGFHTGIDLAALRGTPVYAAQKGIVVQARSVRGYGNMIMIRHGKNFRTRYAHLASIQVKVGDAVRAGQCIGTVGDTGFIRKAGNDGSHLHFEVYERGKRRDPMQFLPK